MSALKGNLNDLRKLKSRIKGFPITLAAGVARRAAPDLTQFTKTAFTSGSTVYGDARPISVDGDRLTLSGTGATERQLQFVHIGTIIRCKLGTDWAKYLIGKYKILPMGAMPLRWGQRLGAIVRETKF